MAAISQKKSTKGNLIVLPYNFDLDEHLKATYIPLPRFKKEKVYYFLGLLSSIPARNPDIVTEDGFVPINHKLIRNNIKDIIYYIDYLFSTGVIERDNHYIPEEKSIGYKWAKKYSPNRFIVKQIESKYYDYNAEQYAWQFEMYPYLFHWYQQNKLMVDEDAANDHAFELYQDKMNDPTKRSWEVNNKGERKNPETQYRSAILNIAKIKYYQYQPNIDSNVHRLHSAFTGLGKKYRQFITYNGEKLVGIDITNSQPYIISLILNKDFWSANSSLSLSINNLPDNIQDTLKVPPELLAMIVEYFNSIEEIDIAQFRRYMSLVSSGKFYERVAEIIKFGDEIVQGREITREERDEAKLLMFYTMYSSNYLPQKTSLRRMRYMFKDMFPKVAELFQIIKRNFKNVDIEKQHNRLAKLLQSIESNIVLHKCCKRIWIEGNQQVPVFTIHDNIVTTQGNENFVRKIMYEELERHIGIEPPLSKPEIWG